MATSTSSPPNPQAVQALINALNNGQLAQAETLAKELISRSEERRVGKECA